MWTYTVAIADNIKDSKLYDVSPKTKTIDEIEVRIVYTCFDDPKEAVVRAVSQHLYGGNAYGKAGMDKWTYEDLEKISLSQLITYYKYSNKGIYISIPVKIPEK